MTLLTATDLQDLLIALDLRILHYRNAPAAETYALALNQAHATALETLRAKLDALTPEIGAGVAARVELVAAPRVGARWGRKTDLLTVGEGEEFETWLHNRERRETAPIHTQEEE